MKRLAASVATSAACVWLAAQPAGCTYDVPALVAGGAAGAGGGEPSASTTASSVSASTGSGASCDLDGPPCTSCPETQACHPIYGCTQCAVDTDCDEPARPYCVEGRCRACGDPSHCMPGEICQVRIGDEMECALPCVQDGDCDDNDDICDPTGRCVECVPGSCTNDRACDPVTGKCEDCVADADCMLNGDDEGLHCGADRRCHECVVDAHCGPSGVCINQRCEIACCGDADCASEPSFNACNTTTARCVQCNVDAQCAAPAPFCETTLHQCVECLVPAQCPPGSPYCEGFGCQACTTATEATDCSAPTPRCYGGACAQCSPATQASDCPSGAPICRGGTCVECQFDTDCTGAFQPYCSPMSTCVQCTSVIHCTAPLDCIDYQCQ